jgi:hypothetical protein
MLRPVSRRGRAAPGGLACRRRRDFAGSEHWRRGDWPHERGRGSDRRSSRGRDNPVGRRRTSRRTTSNSTRKRERRGPRLWGTARNLAADLERGTYDSSKARLWVYDRRLELVTRAFTLFGASRSSGRGGQRATSQHVVSRSPVILVEVVPSQPGGDSPACGTTSITVYSMIPTTRRPRSSTSGGRHSGSCSCRTFCATHDRHHPLGHSSWRMDANKAIRLEFCG